MLLMLLFGFCHSSYLIHIWITIYFCCFFLSGKRLFGNGYSGLEYDYRGLLRLYQSRGDAEKATEYATILHEWNHLRDRKHNESEVSLEFKVSETCEAAVEEFFQLPGRGSLWDWCSVEKTYNALREEWYWCSARIVSGSVTDGHSFWWYFLKLSRKNSVQCSRPIDCFRKIFSNFWDFLVDAKFYCSSLSLRITGK